MEGNKTVVPHTPTPWYGDENGDGIISKPLSCRVATVEYPGYDERSIAEGMANAAFIVRACNSYQPMVDALKGLLALPANAEWVDQINRGVGVNTPYGQRFVAALAALAAAEGQQ